MTILGISNRTENWRTARYFAPFIECDSARAVLAQRLGEPEDTPSRDIQIELFWKGMRDYLERESLKAGELSDCFAQSYRNHFYSLREAIEGFRGFNNLKDCNYDASHSDKLSDNLARTEIDIVLQTPRHLFIGEAKDEGDLGTNRAYVLVHQMIRQYVMARILIDLISSNKTVIAFIVGNAGKIASLTRTTQVKFMISKGWMKEQNVLSWNEIGEIAEAGLPQHLG